MHIEGVQRRIRKYFQVESRLKFTARNYSLAAEHFPGVNVIRLYFFHLLGLVRNNSVSTEWDRQSVVVFLQFNRDVTILVASIELEDNF